MDYIGSRCDFAGIRTQGPYIKSVLLYQLSYEIVLAGAKLLYYSNSTSKISLFLFISLKFILSY